MASGKPAVVAPLGADQAVQGARLMSVGAARTLGPKRTVESFRGEIERVLEEPVYRNNAMRLRAEIEAMPSAPDVVQLVEQLAETGGPVLNR